MLTAIKKGNASQIENYHPISNPCTTSKFFEKLILLRVQKLEKFNNVDLTGKPKNGFKAKYSTMTTGMKQQFVIARALDNDGYTLMSSLDLSSAFEDMNAGLLIKRLKIIGLPDEIISLVNQWLTSRYFT